MSDVNASQKRLSIDYAGTMGPLFSLILKTNFLTIITLGIYRFWMKARVRGYYWSAIRPDDTPLEYTGTGLEKLLGFFIAVVFLAVYLGTIQLLLSFLGLAYFSGNQQIAAISLNLSFIAVLPLVYFAQYRARRYILSRTRWRGVRFGMESAAVKYAFYAIGQTLLSIITLGLLFPRQTFKMEKFRTDRTRFGSLSLRQGGRWQMIFRPWLTFYGVLMVGAALFFLGASMTRPIFIGLGFLVVYLGGAVSYLYFSVAAFKEMARHKEAGHSIRFYSDVRIGTVLRIYTLGGLAIFLLFALIMLTLSLAIGTSISIDLNFVTAFGAPATAAIYLLSLLLFGALTQVFITQPLLAHYMTTLTVENAEELDDVLQRSEDEMVEADGFADALDVGAAI